MDCIRHGKFGDNEKHKCFVKGCPDRFEPLKNRTCGLCNWKFCDNDHCGCSVSKETKEALDKFYDLFCNLNNYSDETKNALAIMMETYRKYCLKAFKITNLENGDEPYCTK